MYFGLKSTYFEKHLWTAASWLSMVPSYIGVKVQGIYRMTKSGFKGRVTGVVFCF